MATSGSTNWTVNRNEIINAAWRKIGAVGEGQTASAEMLVDASQALNAMIKEWLAEGIGLWLYDAFSVTIVTDTKSYTMGSGGAVDMDRPLDIVEARYHYYTSGTDLPMMKISRQEYLDLPDKGATGTSTNFYYDPQLSLGVLYVWPIVSSTGTISDTIIGTAKVPVEDFDAAANNPDFPQEWFSALMWNLACDLAPELGKEPTTYMLRRADIALFRASEWDRERTPVIFGVDRR